MICTRRNNKENSSICKHHITAATLGQQDVPTEPGFCALPSMFRCIDDLSARIPRLSHSTIQDWLKCRRLYYIKHIAGVEMIQKMMSPALKMGSLWDACIQVFNGHDNSIIKETIERYEIDEFSVATVKAMFRAHKTLGIQYEEGGELQKRFQMPLDVDAVYSFNTKHNAPLYTFVVTGVYDRKYEDYIAETKFSSKPDIYLDLFFQTSQVGTYFLSDPRLDYCVMEVTRSAGLRRKEDESAPEWEERVYEDVLRRPSFYFIGWDKDKKMFGKKIYRKELDLDGLAKRYKDISYEIMEANERGAFYKNTTACMFPWQCDMLDVCRNDVVSEQVYKIRPKYIME